MEMRLRAPVTRDIRNIFRVLMFQQFLAYRHQRLRDSMAGRAEVWHWTPTKRNKHPAEHEPRLAIAARLIKTKGTK